MTPTQQPYKNMSWEHETRHQIGSFLEITSCLVNSACSCRNAETNFSPCSDQLPNFCLMFQILSITETATWCDADILTTTNVRQTLDPGLVLLAVYRTDNSEMRQRVGSVLRCWSVTEGGNINVVFKWFVQASGWTNNVTTNQTVARYKHLTLRLVAYIMTNTISSSLSLSGVSNAPSKPDCGSSIWEEMAWPNNVS